MPAPLPSAKFQSLPRLFKGAGPGTYWWNQYRQNGGALPSGISSPRRVGVVSVNDIVLHITAYSSNSPVTSVTTSFAIALRYARVGPAGAASETNPGYVFEIDSFRAPKDIRWFDPIAAVTTKGIVHHHQGDETLVMMLAGGRNLPLRPVPVPGGGAQIPVFTTELKAVVNAVRDAELLVEEIPPACVVGCHQVTV